MTDEKRKLDQIASQLRTAVRLLVRRAYTATGDKGPARSEQGVLSLLDEKGAMTPSALAAIEKVRPQTIGQTLDALDRRQWIKRTPHLRDRRQVLISLSPLGRKALTQGRQLRQAWLVRELQKLNRKDLATLAAGVEVLGRIAQS